MPAKIERWQRLVVPEGFVPEGFGEKPLREGLDQKKKPLQLVLVISVLIEGLQ